MAVVASVLDLIGSTPLIDVSELSPNPNVRILGKAEFLNPAGSVKDRIARQMILEAEEDGTLRPGSVIIEPSSGNTGIALAMICRVRGYHLKVVLPENVTEERRAALLAFGAEVIDSPGAEGSNGAVRRALELSDKHPEWVFLYQYANEANPRAHYETTGPEILDQTRGEVDVVVAGMGTTGTLMGISQFLREKKPSARVVGVEPPEGHCIQGLKNMNEAIRPKIYDAGMLHEVVSVDDGEAYETTRLLATREGIFAGMSSGAAVAAALNLAKTMKSGTIVAILPDRGDRYLSTTLFRSICAKCPP